MAPSAIETLINHFNDFKSTPKDYDLILTGDLSQIGFSVVSRALNDKFGNVIIDFILEVIICLKKKLMLH